MCAYACVDTEYVCMCRLPEAGKRSSHMCVLWEVCVALEDRSMSELVACCV